MIMLKPLNPISIGVNMNIELEDHWQNSGRSPNYLKFSVTPVMEDNLLMISMDASGVGSRPNHQNFNETIEIIFEVSLN
jgi:hypothetical protein